MHPAAMTRMTQAQLAERSGVAQSDISDFERGKGNPTVQTLGKLAAALGVSFTIGADVTGAG